MHVNIEKTALELPMHERVALAQTLIESVLDIDSANESAWKEELKRRKNAYDAGKMSTVTMEQVFQRLDVL